MKTLCLFCKYIIAAFFAVVSIPSFADSFEEDGLWYEIDINNSSNVVVTQPPYGYSYSKTSYSIPEKITHEGYVYKVVEIGSWAFSNCSKLLSVELPSSLEKIGRSAFQGCSSITEIRIPKSVIDIDSNPFISCIKLSSLSVEEGNEKYDSRGGCNAILMGESLIAGCLTTIIPEGITAIEDNAFYGLDIENIIIPNTVTVIGDNTFNGCSKLTNVDMSTSLKEIGSWAFSNCSRLLSIELPSSLEKIGRSAFQGCSSITEIRIPKSVIEVDNNPFISCKKLSSLSVEEGNEKYDSRGGCNAILMGESLIAGCLTTIIPEGITTIEDNAFYGLDIESIIIPNTVTVIGDNTFNGCSKLTNVDMSTSLKEIGSWAFSNCSKLLSIELPSSFEKIGRSAFQGCSRMTEITSYDTSPQDVDENAFYGIFDKVILYVPTGMISEYRQKVGWNKFVNIEEIGQPVQFSNDEFTFNASKKKQTATIVSFNKSNNYIEIPVTVKYDDIVYSITEIADSVFANSSVVYIQFSPQIAKIGTGLCYNCNELAAITWLQNYKPSTEFIHNIKNPNLLFYTNSSSLAPDGIRNIIVNGVAETITLSDAEFGRFYNPSSFVAKKISYTHNYSLKTEKNLAQGWESIALPFDVQTYMTSKGEAKPYKVANTGERLFWLRELTESGMVEAEGIKAYTPYIISMPNWDGYQDFYNIEGDVIFSAQNSTVNQTPVIPIESAIIVGIRQFIPSFQKINRVNNCFALNKQHHVPSDTWIGEEVLPGSVFFGNLRDIQPFEAFFMYEDNSSTRAISISELIGQTTSVKDIKNDYWISINGSSINIGNPISPQLPVYSLTGQVIRHISVLDRQIEINNFPSGVYIINGIKVFIK